MQEERHNSIFKIIHFVGHQPVQIEAISLPGFVRKTILSNYGLMFFVQRCRLDS